MKSMRNSRFIIPRLYSDIRLSAYNPHTPQKLIRLTQWRYRAGFNQHISLPREKPRHTNFWDCFLNSPYNVNPRITPNPVRHDKFRNTYFISETLISTVFITNNIIHESGDSSPYIIHTIKVL